MVDSQYYLPNDIGISALDCRVAFRLLSPKEQMYAHYLSRASWYGGLIVLIQTSPESANIYVLLQKIFRLQAPQQLEAAATAAGLSAEEYQVKQPVTTPKLANIRSVFIFHNNVLSEKFKALVWESLAFKQSPGDMETLWGCCCEPLYSLEDKQKQLGLGEKGISAYFSGNCCLEDAEFAQKFLDSKNLSAYNTRLFKTEIDGKRCYEVRLASAEKGDEVCCGKHEFEDSVFSVKRGDYAFLMEKVCQNLEKAKDYAANENQKRMLEEYIRSFTCGSVEAHKEGSRYWIKDKGPIVESYIGFIESYRDPFGSRGEFEGELKYLWVNMMMLIAFLRPLCLSLSLSLSLSDDDIRQTEGFKNVSLGNVLAVAYATQKDKLTFLEENDKDLYIKWKGPSFEVQVGLHELLGHGSGKLFVQDDKGKYNFDQTAVRNPETGELISSWYKGSETWDSKFSTIASSYEECRAECVGLYLCLNKQVLSIFGHEGEDAEEVVYVNWLNMVRAGLLGLEFYTPESKSWRQAHMQARFVILRVLLEAGEGLVGLRECTGADGRPDAVITLDRSKIYTVGKSAIQRFLCKLQVHKSTADVEGGRALYEGYSAVTADGTHNFLRLRETVLLRKEARKMFVQANTYIKGDAVELVEYEGSAAGLIQSFVERFPDDAEEVEAQLREMTCMDSSCWC
uniref:Dipeptidyl peptidase 3 n=1 Tax=Cyprinus carpio TaxID=7962 RepID=A0A8C1NY53_CYPCA